MREYVIEFRNGVNMIVKAGSEDDARSQGEILAVTFQTTVYSVYEDAE